MSYQERLALYQEIEDLRGHPLICYVTSIRPYASGQISSDVIPEFIKQINEISEVHDEVDLLVASNGGDPNVAARIIGLLRERFNKVSVLLPYVAFSAATLMALGADEIVMHPFSNLGPVDPQLVVTRSGQDGLLETITYGVEDLRNYVAFVKSEVGISDQEQLARAVEALCKEVGAVSIGVAKRSAHLTTSLGEKLLSLHIKDSGKAKIITETLSRSYYHHGYPVGRSEAKNIELPVVDAPHDLEKAIWLVWEDLEKEMECNEVFNPITTVLNGPGASQLLDLGAQDVVTVPPMDYELFLATLESSRGRSELKKGGRITAMRQPDMNIVAGVIQLYEGWAYSKASQ